MGATNVVTKRSNVARRRVSRQTAASAIVDMVAVGRTFIDGDEPAKHFASDPLLWDDDYTVWNADTCLRSGVVLRDPRVAVPVATPNDDNYSHNHDHLHLSLAFRSNRRGIRLLPCVQ